MNTKMNLIFCVPFLLFGVADSFRMLEIQAQFRECRMFLDSYAMTDCQYAQNIHLCTEMLNGWIGSRGNQELDRLGCTEQVKYCKTSDMQNCKQRNPNSCSDLKTMKNCFYQQKCTKHYNLLDNYYTNGCLKTNCNSIDVKKCDRPPRDDSKKAVCENLEKIYECVLRKQSYNHSICKMPAEWQKDYKDNTCEHPCYNIPKPYLNGMTDEDKCKSLKKYILELHYKNCNLPDDMEKEYKSSKCDTRCNKENNCIIHINEIESRDINCKRLSTAIKCLENAKCPIFQYIYDISAFYGCSTSCNNNVLTGCLDTLKEPLNSTREEQCSFLREQRGCYEKSRCKVNDKYIMQLECSGATSWNTMFSFIISTLLTIQMLEKYIYLC